MKNASFLLAIGRILVGVVSLTSPSLLSSIMKISGSYHLPEVAVMARLFGVREVALGSALLFLDAASILKLGLFVDAADALAVFYGYLFESLTLNQVMGTLPGAIGALLLGWLGLKSIQHKKK
jgi:hypothetical protein